MANSTTDINDIVKETLDAKIYNSYEFNDNTLKMIKREVPTEGITGRGRNFAVKVGSNESYASISEGGNFPAGVDINYLTATVNYRRQFSSFNFTGDVEDLRNSKTLRDALSEIVDDTMESFDEKQNFFLFGKGTGIIATTTTIASAAYTCATSVSNGYGARMVRQGQLLSVLDTDLSTDHGDVTPDSGTPINRSTDLVTMAAAIGGSEASGDHLTFRDSMNLAPQGFLYHISNADTWLGLSRSTYTSLGSVIHDAASASLDPDMVEIALLKSRNVRGDNAPKFDYMLVGHPVQHKNLRSLIRNSGNVQYNAPISGTKKGDLLIQDVSFAGMMLHEDSWCNPSDLWGIKKDSWAIEEVKPRQLYKHSDGNIFIQSLGASTTYADAKEGRVYWRYNFVCKEPFKNFRIKNVNFEASEVVIQRS